MEALLNEVYYSPQSPAAFTGIEKVYLEAKKRLPSLTRSKVKEWLERQYTYTMHKPIRHKFERRKILVAGKDDQWQMDLADMVQLRRYNDGYQFLLTIIDIYSKFAWVVPIKNKSGHEVARALDSVFKQGRVPNKLQSDKGREFLNGIVQQLLKQYGIKFFTSEDPNIKCAVVERFNRTIKGKIWKYFTKSRKYRYIDVLSSLVDGYNNSHHRTIKATPASGSVHQDISSPVYEAPRFEVGDKVRISKAKGTFEKGYLPNWSEEIFTITRRHSTYPIVYSIQDYYGEPIKGTFYAQELQKTEVEEYWIEKVIKRRGDQALVKWVGYKEPTWIPAEDIKEY